MLRDKSLYADLLFAVMLAAAAGWLMATVWKNYEAIPFALAFLGLLTSVADLGMAWVFAKPVIADMKEGRGGPLKK